MKLRTPGEVAKDLDLQTPSPLHDRVANLIRSRDAEILKAIEELLGDAADFPTGYSAKATKAIGALFHQDPPVPGWFTNTLIDSHDHLLRNFDVASAWREVLKHMEPKK